MKRQGRPRTGLPDGVLSGAGSAWQSVKETAVSNPPRIPVSREVLETMHKAMAECKDTLASADGANDRDLFGKIQRVENRLIDMMITLEVLCKPQS